MEVKATAGDSRLGGTDFDSRLVDYFLRTSFDSGVVQAAIRQMTKESGTADPHARGVYKSSTVSGLERQQGHHIL